MPLVFTVHPVIEDEVLPDPSTVSSVSIVIFDGEKILWTHHKTRGWDIPGGHVEEGESILDALTREVKEEVGAEVSNLILVATISSNATDPKYAGKVMVIFATRSFRLIDDWIPVADVDSRAILDIDEAMRGYYGDSKGLSAVIDLAEKKLFLSNAKSD